MLVQIKKGHTNTQPFFTTQGYFSAEQAEEHWFNLKAGNYKHLLIIAINLEWFQAFQPPPSRERLTIKKRLCGGRRPIIPIYHPAAPAPVKSQTKIQIIRANAFTCNGEKPNRPGREKKKNFFEGTVKHAREDNRLCETYCSARAREKAMKKT